MSTTSDQDGTRPPPEVESHPAWIRLQDQLRWYDEKSVTNQKYFKYLKIFQIILAVGIPIASHLDPATSKWITSLAGAAIAVVEGIQHLYQYSTLWVTYRSTAEHLKHEKFLFLSSAGPYKNLPRPDSMTLLAERVEQHVSTEHANWITEARRSVKEPKDGRA